VVEKQQVNNMLAIVFFCRRTIAYDLSLRIINTLSIKKASQHAEFLQKKMKREDDWINYARSCLSPFVPR
jgi:hypothetical protein